MKNLKYFILAIAAVLFTMTGCENGPDGYDVDEGSIVVEALGPNPILRGSDMKVVGQNMDRISSVIFPSGIEIKASDFKDVTKNSFKVTVPMDAAEGYVQVVSSAGTYVSKTVMTYTEPFAISSISPTDKSIEMGDVVTIKGEYLNNITSVGFVNGAVVDSSDFITKSRYEITFPVARGAVSGKIYVADVNGNQAYSSEELKIVQPTVAEVSPATVRPGDVVTVSGTLLDQIDEITFSGAAAIKSADFTSVGKSEIKVVVPSDVHDGAVSLTTAADSTLTSSNELTIKVPSNLGISAESRYKSGLNVIVTGKDLDLTTAVAIGGVDADFAYSDGKIKAIIPATAVDGAVTLSTAAGKSASTTAITLVKPVISSMSPTSVVAGKNVEITGTDLDLVTSATLNGSAVTFETNSATKLTITTAATNSTGKVALKCANGVTVASDADLTVTYDSFIIVNSLPSSASVGEEVTMKGSNFNMIESIYFGSVKVTGYSKREADEMSFLIPETVETGTYNIKFVLTTGETETCPLSIVVKGAITTTVIWEGNMDLGTSWGANVNLAWQNMFDYIPYGSRLTVEYETTDEAGYSQVKLMRGSDWTVLSSVTDANAWGCIDVTKGSTVVSYVLNNQDVEDLAKTGLVVGGYSVTIKKVYYSYENTGVNPARPADVMINDYETHGGHDGSWDNSWSGITTIGTSSDGNNFLKITTGDATDAWVINCNHFDNGALTPSVKNFEDYYICFDVLVPSGWSDSGDINMQFVINGGWYWYGADLFSSVKGNGKWQTVAVPATKFGLSGDMSLTADTNGLYVDKTSTHGLPAGMCFDNFRLVHKNCIK